MKTKICSIHTQTLSLFSPLADKLVSGIINMSMAAKMVFQGYFYGLPVKSLFRLEVGDNLQGFTFEGKGDLDCCLF